MRFLSAILSLFLFTSLSAQRQYELKDVVVTAGRVPIQISNITRYVQVIAKQQIDNLPVSSVQETIKYLSGIDLKQRGANGVQADLAVRGSTFEQSLVMINGIKIVDPQTGHHNLNLPITKNDIERIEIVKGQASKTFGPNAYSGVINIITNKKFDRSISVAAEGGENGLYSGSFTGRYSLNNWANSFSIMNSHSDGYRFNTGFDNITYNLSSSLTFESGLFNVMFGYDDKDFGANSFYTVAYPKQAEHTISRLLTLSGHIGDEELLIIPKLYWRNHRDEFLLDKDNPSFYKNIHQSNSYGAEIQTSLTNSFGITSLGVEYAYDDLLSNNLGDHNRERKGLFFEHIFQPLNRLNINAGGFVYKYSNTDWKVWPGVDLSYEVTHNMKLFASVGKAFRVPTYTELYYNDPVTKGNPNLTFEEVAEYEIGISYSNTGIQSNISFFRKEGSNVIDWIRSSDNEAWTVQNITSINTNGIEVSIDLYPKLLQQIGIANVMFGYTYLDSDRSADEFDSRYVLSHLRHDVSLSVFHESIFDLQHSWFFRYKDRINLEDQFTIDTQVSKTISSFEVYLHVTNLLNKSYEDIEGVPLPGRWIKGGIKYEIDF